MFARCVGLLLSLCFSISEVAGDTRPKIAIIIDDLGYERAAGERAIALPGPVSFAILPGTPRGAYLAEAAHAAGKQVLLHLPLQPLSRDEKPDPGSLHLDMSRAEFAAAFRSNLAAVPHVAGINSHRGSLLTRHPGHMQWLMKEIAESAGLFFVDSYTTADSVALRMAAENGVPSLKRDVFLDPDREPETLEREFARLRALADTKGFAVGIGHPYPATLSFLETALPRLEEAGYELVEVGRLAEAAARNPVLPAAASAE